jgi:prevent-host-death family protein
MTSGKGSEEVRPIGDVKARLAECVRAAEAGVTTVLTRHGRPVARLMPYGGEPTMSDWALATEVREGRRSYAVNVEESFCPKDARRAALRRLLEEEIHPRVPAELQGKGISKREREQILGFGKDGV